MWSQAYFKGYWSLKLKNNNWRGKSRCGTRISFMRVHNHRMHSSSVEHGTPMQEVPGSILSQSPWNVFAHNRPIGLYIYQSEAEAPWCIVDELNNAYMCICAENSAVDVFSIGATHLKGCYWECLFSPVFKCIYSCSSSYPFNFCVSVHEKT